MYVSCKINPPSKNVLLVAFMSVMIIVGDLIGRNKGTYLDDFKLGDLFGQKRKTYLDRRTILEGGLVLRDTGLMIVFIKFQIF